MEHKYPYSILQALTDGILPAQTAKRVRSWLLDTETPERDEALDALWDTLQVPGHAREEVGKALYVHQRRRQQWDEACRLRSARLRFFRWAAVLLLPLIAAAGTWVLTSRYTARSQQMTEVNVGDGETTRLILPDGSKVEMNGGSRIVYPRHFSPWTDRNVYMSGDINFEVAKDSRHPFIVNVDRLNIRVLGTVFNICAYPDEPTISTTLKEGRVEVSDERQRVLMNPNERVVYDKGTATLSKVSVSPSAAIARTQGRLTFDQQPLQAILTTLRHQYNVSFKVDRRIDLNKTYSMNFISGENLIDVLNVLEEISDHIRYRKSGNTVTLYQEHGGSD